jgi:hypothetical protein
MSKIPSEEIVAELKIGVKELKFNNEVIKYELDNSIFTYNGRNVKWEFKDTVSSIPLEDKVFNIEEFIVEVIKKYGKSNIKFYHIMTPTGDNLFAQIGTDESDVEVNKII